MNYIKEAIRTESTVFNIEVGDDRLLHAGIGIATEGGEFLDALKKHVFYGKELDRVNLKEELGDLMWYAAIACDELGTTFEELQATNIAKLRARYPETFTYDNTENRDLEEERKILEGSCLITFKMIQEEASEVFGDIEDCIPDAVIFGEQAYEFSDDVPKKVRKKAAKFFDTDPQDEEACEKAFFKLQKAVNECG